MVPTSEEDLAFLTMFFQRPDVFEYWDGERLTEERVAADYIGRRSPAVECFLITVPDTRVGFVQYASTDEGGDCGGIDMVLMKEFRRQGIGRTAVEALVHYLRNERRWSRITVDPDAWNGGGLAFWSSAGFEPVELIEDDPARDPYWLMEYEGQGV